MKKIKLLLILTIISSFALIAIFYAKLEHRSPSEILSLEKHNFIETKGPKGATVFFVHGWPDDPHLFDKAISQYCGP